MNQRNQLKNFQINLSIYNAGYIGNAIYSNFVANAPQLHCKKQLIKLKTKDKKLNRALEL